MGGEFFSKTIEVNIPSSHFDHWGFILKFFVKDLPTASLQLFEGFSAKKIT